MLLDELKGFFRPEFLNRVDDVVVFKALSKDDLRAVVDIQLRRLERLLSDKEIKLDLTNGPKGGSSSLASSQALAHAR